MTDRVEGQQIHLDLRRPLTRAEAGIERGRNTVAIDRDPASMLDVRLALPDGRFFAAPAIGVVLASAPGFTVAPPEVEPSVVVVNRIEPDVVAARSALLADAALLGLDPERVDEATAGDGAGGGRRSVDLPSHDIGYLSAQVGVRDNVERVQITYTFIWGAYADRVRAFERSARTPG